METRAFFNQEIKKLGEQFGLKNFSQHKCELIYKAISHLNEADMALVFDEIIGNNRTPPTVADFSLKASDRRERKAAFDKSKESSEIANNFTNEEQKNILGSILKCIESNKLERLSGLFKHIKNPNGTCLFCNSSGIVNAVDQDRLEYAFKCSCKVGKLTDCYWPSWSNQIGFKLKFSPY